MNTIQKLIAAVSLSLMSIGGNAQYVTIPDAKFAAWLNTNVPSAMSGNRMDTTNAAVLTRARIDVENLGIRNLYGVQYFKALITLDCGNGSPSIDSNHLTSLPHLPSTLDSLICGNNQLTSIPVLPSGLIYLACYINQLNSLPALPLTLTYLDCNSNFLSSFPVLPDSLLIFECEDNNIVNLPVLPGTITNLDCSYNKIDSLPSLPLGLTYLDCSSNPLIYLPSLPFPLQSLVCENDSLTTLPNLPNLIYLICDGNKLISLPVLPASLHWLFCSSNLLTNLPALPGLLQALWCENNNLINLPSLPGSLQQLLCSSNQLLSIPSLPTYLTVLWCSYNNLTTLPSLPAGLTRLICNNNNISCFPMFPDSLRDTNNVNIYPNPFTCLPNYVRGMDKPTLAYPLCLPGNINGCSPSVGIVGYTYNDMNNNCIRDNGDQNLVNIPMKFYNHSNVLLSQAYSAINGVYDFPDTAGTYKVLVDTSGNLPFRAQCVHPGLDSVVRLTSLDTNVNFSITCKPGFDVGVQSIVTEGLIFPGMQHDLSIVAGDLSQWFNLNCANGDSGTVQIVVSGPVTYIGPGAGALTPVVNGNVFTYHIVNYGTINNNTAFNLILKTDTNAQAGDVICANITVTPLRDNNPVNNTYQYCYTVVNSHDPNYKEVYPVDVKPDYAGWLTYTIHFQNTGNAASNNIVITDTLSSDLNISTFQLINYSHQNTVFLNKNVLTVRFGGIDLPDTSVSKTSSIGFVQYRIKPNANLPNGTVIKNTGYIFFDYNAPVVTNTAENLFAKSASVNTIEAETSCKVFPNPNNGSFTLLLSGVTEKCNVEVYDVLGKRIYTLPLAPKGREGISASYNINLSTQPNGVYFYRVVSEDGGLVGEGKVVLQK